jgi:hypothetical protein
MGQPALTVNGRRGRHNAGHPSTRFSWPVGNTTLG